MSENKTTNTRAKKFIPSVAGGFVIGIAAFGGAYFWTDLGDSARKIDQKILTTLKGEKSDESKVFIGDENSEVTMRDGKVHVIRYELVANFAKNAAAGEPSEPRDKVLNLVSAAMADGILTNGEYNRINDADTEYNQYKRDVSNYLIMMGDNRDTVAGKAFIKVVRDLSSDGKITDEEFKIIESAHAEYEKSMSMADINKALSDR